MAAAGVYITQKKDGTACYRAGISLHNRHISLGSYPTEAQANAAYCEARQLYESDLSVEDYGRTGRVLSFPRYVSILNLRDHGIYFKTPIYLAQKYFFYYLSESIVLTFDTDDLFYYSTHTIMKRGNHLFVADYGMQVNILSRYGIREHAVSGRDYVFANGNPHDFRYGNIILLNPYHGVRQITRRGKILYQARIHLHGDYVIGAYSTPEEAAIAYNKAADLVRRNGCSINFPENYPEGISNREYAAIYQELSISPKVMAYRPQGK